MGFKDISRNKIALSCEFINKLIDNYYCYFYVWYCVLETLKLFYKQWVLFFLVNGVPL